MDRNQPLIEQLNRYRGRELQYTDSKGNIQKRVLSSVMYHEMSQQHFAFFEYKRSEPWKKFLFELIRVPLHQVKVPSAPEFKMRDTPGYYYPKVSTPTFQNFHFYGNYYAAIKSLDFNAGDQVVWTTYSNRDVGPCVGILMLIARTDSMNVREGFQEVAVVGMERMVTTDSGTPAPGNLPFLKSPQYQFPFVIPMEQVLKLDEWMISMTFEEEDEWTVVGSRKGKKDRQPKEDDLHIVDSGPESRCKPPNNVGFNEVPVTREPGVLRRDARPNTVIGLPNELPAPADQGILSWEQKVDRNHFFALAQQTNGIGVGIQGHNNSCYMDASLFALFPFMHSIDKLLEKSLDEFLDTSEWAAVGAKVKTIVKKIARNIRQNFFVRLEEVRRLRKIMSREINPEYLSQCMDAEDFLTDFFKLINAPPLIKYDNGEGDYAHQIALPFTWEESQHRPYLALQDLLDNSFKAFGVRLEKVPEDVFIVKLPVSDGALIPSDGVIPNLTLDMGKILQNARQGEEHKMILQAVICLKSQHFVTFVRTDKTSPNTPWVYMDSRPTIQEPFTSVLYTVDETIALAVEELQRGNLQGIPSLEPTCQDFAMFRHAYICIYVKK